MPKNVTAPAAAPVLPVEPIAPVAPVETAAPVDAAPAAADAEGEEENGGSDFRVLALIPVEGEEGAYTARIFMNRTDVKKNLKLDNLPEGILFYRGKRLLPKVQTVVTL